MSNRFLVSILACLTTLIVQAQPLPRDPKLRVGQLENGLTYYIYPNQTPRGEAVYRLFVKAGSVQERDDQQGLAHFLEHLAFNGTRHFPGDGIVRFLESRGAKFGKDLNAHTSFTETVYKLQLPSADPLLVDTTLTILSDWAGGLLIAPEEVEKERGVILSERLARSSAKADHSMHLVQELLNGSLYSRRITIGDTAVISHATPETIRQYYQQWYRPELMAVAVMGDVDAVKVERLIREKFAGLKRHTDAINQSVPSIPEYTTHEAKIVTTKGVEAIDFDILMLLPQPSAVQTADDYHSYLERSILNSLMRLRFNALSFDDPAYGKANIQYSRFLGATGVTDASVELTRGKVRQGIKDFMAAYHQILRYGFTQYEIDRAKKSLLNRLEKKASVSQNTTSSSLMDEIYSDFYDGNRLVSRTEELQLVRKCLPQIDSVRMVRFIHGIFETRPLHYLLRGNNEVLGEVSDEADLFMLVDGTRRRPVSRYWHPVQVPDALPSLSSKRQHIVSEKPIPEIGATDIRLDNGARVIFRRSDMDNNRLTLSAFRKGGQYGIDSTRYFTSVIGPSVISLSGAGDFSREALNHYMTGKSASVRMLVDKLRTGVVASAHMTDVETMFQLLHLRWTQPRLDTTVCRMTLDKLLESNRTRKETPSERFSRELNWLMSGRNYTNEPMTDSVINRYVRTDDMLPLQHSFYGPATGYTFVILADCELSDVRSYINAYLGGLPSGQIDTTWHFNSRHIPHHHVELVRRTNNREKASVTLVYQQDKGVGSMYEQDVKGTILKSVLRSALLKRLREEMGKVYSVSTSVAAALYPSYLCRTTIAFSCQPEDVDTLIAATTEELERLYNHPEDYQLYLDDVKQNLIKEHALQQQQTSYWTSWIRNAVYNNQEDWTWNGRYDEFVRSLTVDDIADYGRHVLQSAYRVKGVLLPAPAVSSSPVTTSLSVSVSGVVFEDRNQNGIQDKGERGLKGFLVTNGDTIVVTDRHGRYTLPWVQGNSILPILPADYTMSGSRLVNAHFVYDHQRGTAQEGRPVDFAVVRKKVNRRFTLNAVGDVQVGNYQELDYATRTLWPELLEPGDKPTINLFLGDLVNNNLKLYDDLRTLMEQLPQPTWTVLGNHDRDVDTVRWRQTKTYNQVFGADMYAFNEGRVHFIVLNNVYGEGARGYKGYLSERQLNFVRQDLKHVPHDKLLVLSMHIPLAHTRNHDALIELLEGRGDVLVISGHMHRVGRYFMQGRGVRLHELSAGASCGFWWVGEKDMDGVPAALQQCGTPRNYFIVDFEDTHYTLRCKAIEQDARRQMTIHVTGIDTLDTHLRDMKDLPDGLLMLTVYGGCDSTTVRCRIDGGEWLTCKKSDYIDPHVARAREMNLRRITPTRFNRMNPLRRRESHQIWSLQLPSSSLMGAHHVEVEASDRWGFRATGRRSFCFPKMVK